MTVDGTWYGNWRKFLCATMCLFKLNKDLQALLQMTQVVSPYLKRSVACSHHSWDFIWLAYPALERKNTVTDSWTWESNCIHFLYDRLNLSWFLRLSSKEAYSVLNVFLYSDIPNANFLQPRILIFSNLKIFLISL